MTSRQTGVAETARRKRSLSLFPLFPSSRPKRAMLCSAGPRFKCALLSWLPDVCLPSALALAIRVLAATIVFSLLATNGLAVQRWEKTYGTDGDDIGWGVRQTMDGGYIVAGGTKTALWLVKTDSFGDTIWTKTYGPYARTGFCGARAVLEVPDGGYIVAGGIEGDSLSDGRMYVLRTDHSGESLWARKYGGPPYVLAYDIEPTGDGGYVVVGPQGVTQGRPDVLVVRIDSSGGTLWTRTYGGSGTESASSIRQTDDGGFVIAGRTTSYGAASEDGLLIRTDSLGDTLWTRIYGGRWEDAFCAVQATSDGGFIVAGATSSYGAGSYDFWLVKTDSVGETLWTRTYGGASHDACGACRVTSDGGYILAGQTFSFGAGGSDVWLVKVDAKGDSQWTRTFGGADWDNPNAIQQTADGGYVVAGNTWLGAAVNEVYLIKTDALGSAGIADESDERVDQRKARLRIESVIAAGSRRVATYFLPRSGFTTLGLFDLAGRRRATLVAEDLPSGWHETVLPSRLCAGTYLLLLDVAGQRATGKVVVCPWKGGAGRTSKMW